MNGSRESLIVDVIYSHPFVLCRVLHGGTQHTFTTKASSMRAFESVTWKIICKHWHHATMPLRIILQHSSLDYGPLSYVTVPIRDGLETVSQNSLTSHN